MAERALAHIEKIEWIRPIEGADNIELIGVLGWVCIAKKNQLRMILEHRIYFKIFNIIYYRIIIVKFWINF